MEKVEDNSEVSILNNGEIDKIIMKSRKRNIFGKIIMLSYI